MNAATILAIVDATIALTEKTSELLEAAKKDGLITAEEQQARRNQITALKEKYNV